MQGDDTHASELEMRVAELEWENRRLHEALQVYEARKREKEAMEKVEVAVLEDDVVFRLHRHGPRGRG